MNKTPFIIAIPTIAVVLVLGAVVAWKMMAPSAAPPVTATPYVPTTMDEGTTKPSNSFGVAPSAGASGQTVTTSATSDLQTSLDGIGDDGGASDFDALEKDASSL